MVAAIAASGIDGTEPATKVDGLLWVSPQGQLLVWYNGQWRNLRGGTIDSYPATTPVATPANAAVALVGPGSAHPAPQTNGQLLYDTGTMRLRVWDNIGWLTIP